MAANGNMLLAGTPSTSGRKRQEIAMPGGAQHRECALARIEPLACWPMRSES